MSKQKKWEEIIRSKLENYEADTHPDDWNAILDRLPGSKPIKLFRTLRSVAAVITGLLILSGGYFFFIQNIEKPVVANITESQIIPDSDELPAFYEEDKMSFPEQESLNELPVQSDVDQYDYETQKKENITVKTTWRKEENKIKTAFIAGELKSRKVLLDIHQQENIGFTELNIQEEISPKEMIAYSTISGKPYVSPPKRWGIGMGGGSYSVGTDGGAMPLLSYPTSLLTFNSDALKSSANVANKQNVSHKRPVSFGVGIGYALSDRWSLQSGLYYTMLKSEWWFVSDYQGVSKQKLHFLGIPLGVSYKIAEWKKIRLYASAGGMTELNMSGSIKTDFYSDNQLSHKVTSKEESIRMSEWQWSVNGKVGVSYPLFKFVNAFIEGGGNYYFDTGSSIETIRTDKPFHVSLQAGIRLGF
ncbi:MAG: PorT family protein [Tannerella sp.]|jgi:hypothetical protein|nr:PorT family protein [Tannerella sp.]